MDILLQVEQSGFGTFIRESPSLWSYPTFLFLHTVGLGFLVGTSVAVDLRVLGFGREMSLAPMERFYPALWFGFWISAISGIVIWTADAATLTRNPVFWVKMGAIALGMASVRLMRAWAFRPGTPDPAPAALRGLAFASLTLWTIAITAGRLTAYIGK